MKYSESLKKNRDFQQVYKRGEAYEGSCRIRASEYG